MTKGAHVQIDRAALEVQTYLVSEGLETEAARRFLESGLPTVEGLMRPSRSRKSRSSWGRGNERPR
jgi:hypothetical protein